ncbi:hypothetical protein EV06_0444 [Prochlorococcus sp. MIT 0602]|nr:hypothetical protein EV06_0444 [Prochlorococcus sp. MIT 0602]KGG18426.1 hypothetical protein EV07_0342 [Prochlorococcus sp. MIT 0603]
MEKNQASSLIQVKASLVQKTKYFLESRNPKGSDLRRALT